MEDDLVPVEEVIDEQSLGDVPTDILAKFEPSEEERAHAKMLSAKLGERIVARRRRALEILAEHDRAGG